MTKTNDEIHAAVEKAHELIKGVDKKVLIVGGIIAVMVAASIIQGAVS